MTPHDQAEKTEWLVMEYSELWWHIESQKSYASGRRCQAARCMLVVYAGRRKGDSSNSRRAKLRDEDASEWVETKNLAAC